MPTSPGASSGHVRTPTALLYAAGLSEGATRLWQVLDDLCRERPSAPATVAQVAAAVSRNPKVPVSKRSVARWRAELVRSGWLLFDAAHHRGEVSVWQPLCRERPVDNRPGRVTQPVDNSAGRVTGVSASDLGKGDTDVTLDGRATRARVQEHKRPDDVIDLRTADADDDTLAALAGRPSSWPSWCGRCHPRSSLADSLLTPGLATRCPACHPTRPVPAF